jgi:hypothetical protein
MKEAVNGLGSNVSDAGYCAERVGAGPEVRHFTEKFKRMALGLNGVSVRILDPADNGYTGRLYFILLAPSGGFDQCTRALDSTAGSQFLDFIAVVIEIRRSDDLDCIETRAVVNVNE